MKTLLFLFFPFFAYSQLYFTPSFGTYGEQYLRAELELKESFVIVQGSYQTNFTDNNLQLKVGFGYRGNVSAYIYLPFLNMKTNGEDRWKYSTPLSAEVFWKSLSLNIDGYKDKIIPSLRFKIKIL